MTPSLEFVRLSVNTKSSELDALAARLTFSGVAWDGAGGVQGDSMVVQMAMSGRAEPSGVLVAHPSDARTLRVQMRTGAAAPLDLTFVRE